MREEAWRRSKRIEDEFLSSLNYIVSLFNKIANSVGDDHRELVRKMETFQESYQFDKFVAASVRRMVTPLAMANRETWRKAAQQQTKSQFIFQTLAREIDEGLRTDIESQIISNAQLIKTLPTDTAEKVVRDVGLLSIQGERASTIAQLIRDKTDQHARASARLIARTEVSKTTTALTRSRAENLGLMWYIWRTAQDGDRVRKSHRIMEGVLVNWHNPPSPERLVGEKDVGNYHAGEIWNCRCYPEPLISTDELRWPVKVYINGRIEKLGKHQFLELIGGI